MKVSNATDATFTQEVLNASTPVLVDFWAPWCGPCRMMAPVLDQYAAENAGKVKVVKVNVDENQSVAGQYGITSIPTMLLFQGGKPLGYLVGFVPKADLERAIDGRLSNLKSA